MNMDELKIYKKPEISSPVMIAGWPGMGSVALGAVDYLQRKLKAVKFAEIKIDPMAALDSVAVEDGVAFIPPGPQNVFYYTKNPDLVIFKGEVQLPGRQGIDLLNELLGFASSLKVSRIFTGAAFPLPVSYKEPPQVYCAVNKASMKNPLARFGVIPMEGGHIAGLNGLVLGFAEKSNIEAACLLATMPQYAIGLPNPKASMAIIEALQRILNFKIDLAEMNEYVKEMDEKMALIEDKVKDAVTLERPGEAKQPAQPAERKVPAYIMAKIEKMFGEAARDRSKAVDLKKELDRWDLYKNYEDRFLDLFKDKQ